MIPTFEVGAKGLEVSSKMGELLLNNGLLDNQFPRPKSVGAEATNVNRFISSKPYQL